MAQWHPFFSTPLVICYIAIENGPVENSEFPINSMVTFHCKLLVYQRVNPIKPR